MARYQWSQAIFGAIVCGTIFGQDDAIADKLATARLEYEKAVEKLRGSLTADIKKKADTAQKSGDLKGLEAAEAELKAFESKGVLPKLVPTKGYDTELRKAKAKMEAAYAVAVSDYTKADQRALAKLAQQKLDEFKAGGGASPAKGGVSKYYVSIGMPFRTKDDGDLVGRSIYELVEGKKWKARAEIYSIDKKAMIRESDLGEYTEVSRSNTTVELQSNSGKVPVRLTPDGLYLYRTYPRVPAPKGVNQNEVKWWKVDTDGELLC